MVTKMLRNNLDILAKGSTGLVVGGVSLAMSVLDVEAWLRIVSLIVGIAVGLASLVAILLRTRSDLKKQRKLDENRKE